MSNIDINDVMAALQLIQEQKAAKPVEAAPVERKKRELSPEHLAKMQEGRRRKAAKRAAAKEGLQTVEELREFVVAAGKAAGWETPPVAPTAPGAAAAAARAAAESAPVVPTAPAAAAAAAVAAAGESFTVKSPHGNLTFVACANKRGQPYVACKVHEGQGGTLILRTVEELKRFLWPLRTCDKSELEGLRDFMTCHERVVEAK